MRRLALFLLLMFAVPALAGNPSDYSFGGAGASGTWNVERRGGNTIQYSGQVGTARSYGHGAYYGESK